MVRRLWLIAMLAISLMISSAMPSIGAQRAQRRPDKGSERRSLTDENIDTPKEVEEAAHDQHGTEEGHLPPSRLNVDLIGRADIENFGPSRVADVAAFGDYAYLTVRDPEACSDAGVAVIDISDPRNPEQVGFVDATEGSFPGEGAQVVDLDTKGFTGQVFVANNELCAIGGDGGATLIDVTDPLDPKVLTDHLGDEDPGGANSRFNEIHSAFAWQQGNRAFVVIVDNEETTDVDILEITDPRNPEFISEADLNLFEVLQPGLLGEASFLHDMVVKKVRGTWTMLLSYWDGGWVLVNVDDPANPKIIDDFEYSDPDTLTGLSPAEGNAHQAEFTRRNKFIIGTDEDFSPFRVDPFEITSGPNAGEFSAGEFGFTIPIAEKYDDEQVNGPSIWGGTGCEEDVDANGVSDREEVPPASELEAGPGEEKTVVFTRGTCFFSVKVESGQLAGYDNVIIGNHHDGAAGGAAPDAHLCGSAGHEFTPTASAECIGHRAMHLMFNDEPEYEPVTAETSPDMPPVGAVGEDVRAATKFDGWGYVRMLDARSLEEVDAYAIAEGLDPDFAFGFGALSVHEVATDPQDNLAYFSYYSGGFRVAKYSQKKGLREVGHYVDETGNNFWGVEVHFVDGEKYILASDRDSGLFIFRYNDPRFERFNVRKANLAGEKEVPGPGDADGTGKARIRLRASTGTVCYRVTWKNIESPFAAHIHEARSDEAGPVVVTLFTDDEPLPDTISGVEGCIEDVDQDLIKDILRHHKRYYVNVHNVDFPAGAIRGQLFKPKP